MKSKRVITNEIIQITIKKTESMNLDECDLLIKNNDRAVIINATMSDGSNNTPKSYDVTSQFVNL